MSEGSGKEIRASGGDIFRQKKHGRETRLLLAKNIPGESPAGRRGQSPRHRAIAGTAC
jgi:hypothetical protein